MSARPSTFVERLRRELLQRPGFSAKPRCPACGKEREPGDFTRSGICQPCELERALEYETRMASELWPDGAPRVDRPVDDAFDSPKPFLPEDED
jgi:hypothetical protein